MITTESVLDDRYRIDVLIDRGGMANVYRARDLRLEREVAVKVLREVEHERRFAAEARTLAGLQHPHLVRLLDAGTDNGDAFLVLELLEGATLRELLSRGRLAPERVTRIGSEAAAALDYIHRRGIVHRDVKPSNLMLDERGSVRLADFGIARLLGSTVTTTLQPIGTMPYIAPEQLEGERVGPPADVYSLGLVLIESLTGRRVFDGPPAVAAAARLSRDPHVPPGLPAPWPAMLRAMTARDPAARPTAARVRAWLDGRGADLTPMTRAVAAPQTVARTEAAPPDVRPARPSRRARHWRLWFAVLAMPALLAAALTAGLLVYEAGSGEPARLGPTTTTATQTAVTSPPATAPPTTAPPTTAPPTTASPTTLPRVEPAPPPPPPANDDGGVGEFQRWLEELRKLLLEE
jgi:eukaryotic-like serine/threonine-protein kinase